MSDALLEVYAVEAGYGEALVLRGVSLRAFESELVAIIGPNGAGKSTLLKVIYGLLRPSAGSVRYRSDDVTGFRPEQLTRLGLNYVPQLGNVFPSLSIAENLLVGSVSLPRSERRAAVDERLCAVSAARGTAPPTRGNALGRSAQAAGDCARARDRPARTAARRALRRTLTTGGGSRLRAACRREEPRHRDRDGRAERASRARAGRPWLRPRHGPQRLRGNRGVATRDPKVTELYLGRSATASSSTSISAPSGIKRPT